MSLMDVKVGAKAPAEQTSSKVVENRPSVARESTGSRRSLQDIAQAKHRTYQKGGILDLPEEVQDYLKSQGISYRWVLATKPGRLSDMTNRVGYEPLHDSHLSPKLQTLMLGWRRPDGTYFSQAGDLVLMIISEARSEEIKELKREKAQEQINAANQRLADNKDFYNKSETRVEKGKFAPTARGRKVSAQED